MKGYATLNMQVGNSSALRVVFPAYRIDFLTWAMVISGNSSEQDGTARASGGISPASAVF